MGLSVIAQLDDQPRLQSSFQVSATLMPVDGNPTVVPLEGCLSLARTAAGFEVTELGLTAIEGLGLDSSVLSARWAGGTASSIPAGNGSEILIEGTLDVTTSSIEDANELVLAPGHNDVYLSHWTPFHASLRLNLTEVDRPFANELVVTESTSGPFMLHGENPLGGRIRGISIDLGGQAFRVFPRRHLRRVRLRPIVFRDGQNTPSGASWLEQLAGVRQVWEPCCLRIDAEPMRVLTRPEVEGTFITPGTNNAPLIRLAFTDRNPRVIEVFIVSANLGASDGYTFSSGSSCAKIVISDQNNGNPFLLAHEFGHVVGGLHPSPPLSVLPPGSWQATPGTVLEESTPAHPVNPDLNSPDNCRRAWNPAFQPIRQSCP